MLTVNDIDAKFPKPKTLSMMDKLGISAAFYDGARAAAVRAARGIYTKEAHDMAARWQVVRGMMQEMRANAAVS